METCVKDLLTCSRYQKTSEIVLFKHFPYKKNKLTKGQTHSLGYDEKMKTCDFYSLGVFNSEMWKNCHSCSNFYIFLSKT